MIIGYFILAALLIVFSMIADEKRTSELFWKTFYVAQLLFGVWIAVFHVDETSATFFTFDLIGILFFVMLSVVAPLVFLHSRYYLDSETLIHYKKYNALLVALCTALAGVYFANNLAVTWIFLEATTICTAGLIYHRRDRRSLEATWKYLFVCSVGIAIAYLGILLLSSVATNGELTYTNLEGLIVDGNPLYLKLAFLFILVGYSCKMEIFPLYTAGIDANSAAPTPASALISTGLVNGGFIALFRVYKILINSQIFPWVSNILIIVGVISLLVGALFLRRTNNYKRFLSYSTVENMGIAIIGLGIGGIGVYAALLHIFAHTFIKSGLFLQLSQVGKLYGSYRINRIGDYIRLSPWGAATIIAGFIAVVAFPPSPFFISEMMIIKQTVINGQWWLLCVIAILICVIIYSFSDHILQLCYKPSARVSVIDAPKVLPYGVLGLFLLVFIMGMWQGNFVFDTIGNIVNFVK